MSLFIYIVTFPTGFLNLNKYAFLCLGVLSILTKVNYYNRVYEFLLIDLQTKVNDVVLVTID